MSAGTRELVAGSLVHVGKGRTVWEVVDPGRFWAAGPAGHEVPIRMVDLRSTRSGLARCVPTRDLVWADTREPVDGPAPTDGTPRARRISDDSQSAVVIGWDAPIVRGRRGDPSSVTLCVQQDSDGRRFLLVRADGPSLEGGAYLDRSAALDLAADIRRLAFDM